MQLKCIYEKLLVKVVKSSDKCSIVRLVGEKRKGNTLFFLIENYTDKRAQASPDEIR